MPTKKKKTAKKTKAKKPKQVVVNKKFLLDLAQLIYDPKTKDFLRLCDGTLQNGPDPTDEKRPMHCGLGELYFEMTGVQPEDAGVSEDDVVDKAVELSTFPKSEQILNDARTTLEKTKLPEHIKERLLEELDCVDDEDLMSSEEEDFRTALSDIPGENDDGCGHAAVAGVDDDGNEVEVCTVADFRKRSQRVAAKLREAAKLLPA